MIKLMNKKVTYTLLGLIILLGLLVRVYVLSKSPASLYWDEMDVGYQAYSILKTGKDYFGNYPFLTVHSFADYRAPAVIFLTIPFIALLDLSPLSVRLPSAIIGTLSIFLMYLLVQELFKNRKISLIAALLFAFVPWSIQYSRLAFEAILMLALFLGGLICFFKGLKNSKWFIGAAVLFSLSLFTYNTTKLFIPVLGLALLVIYFRQLKISKILIISIVIFSLAYLLSLYGTVFLHGGQRFAEISLFTDPQISTQVDFLRQHSNSGFNEQIATGSSPRFLDKLVHNKLTLQLDNISQNYLKVFSTDFLFLNGDPNLRHSASTGEFYRIEALSILLGLAFLLLNLKTNKVGENKNFEKNCLFLLVWVIISPLSAIITREGGNHASRLFLLFPSLTITSALGINYLFSILPKKVNWLVISSIFGVWIFAVLAFLNYYFGSYNLESARFFQYGFDQAVKEAVRKQSQYDYVIIDDKYDSALMNFLFLTKYDPATFQAGVKDMTINFSDSKADRIGNLILMKPGIRSWDNNFTINLIDKNYLLIVSSEQFNQETPELVYKKFTENQKLLGIIKYKSGTPAFYIIESKKPIPKL